MKKTITLKKFGIKITLLGNKQGELVGGLDNQFGELTDNKHGNYLLGAKDALESLILGHACAGVDVASKEYQEGILTALNAIENYI